MGKLEKIGEYERVLVFADGEQIHCDDVLDITCDLFRGME